MSSHQRPRAIPATLRGPLRRHTWAELAGQCPRPTHPGDAVLGHHSQQVPALRCGKALASPKQLFGFNPVGSSWGLEPREHTGIVLGNAALGRARARSHQLPAQGSRCQPSTRKQGSRHMAPGCGRCHRGARGPAPAWASCGAGPAWAGDTRHPEAGGLTLMERVTGIGGGNFCFPPWRLSQPAMAQRLVPALPRTAREPRSPGCWDRGTAGDGSDAPGARWPRGCPAAALPVLALSTAPPA